MKTYISRLLLALTLGALPLLVPATAAAHDAVLLKALAGIDTVPTAEQLRSVLEEPERALYDVALDASANSYLRERATSLLSLFPSVTTAGYLEQLAGSTTDERLRWTAAYTRIRAFALSAPGGALGFAKIWLTRATPNDRDAAVRGLRWVAGPEAEALLAGALERETNTDLLAAIRYVQRARRAAGR